MRFPISGVECSPLLPPVVAFAVALLTTPAGVSGAFLLLPFQMSAMGFITPGVTPTNLLYNIVATPGGVYRYVRYGRMDWPLALWICAGSLPGVFAGAVIRVRYLPDPNAIRVVVAAVLLYLCWRLLKTHTISECKLIAYAPRPPVSRVLLLAGAVGLVGGIYGIGGGAIIAPFLLGVWHLSASNVAGAALFGTLVTSVAGIAVFSAMGGTGSPDWALGLLFGIGGLAGSYCGARLQRHLRESVIRLILAGVIALIAVFYLTRAMLR